MDFHRLNQFDTLPALTFMLKFWGSDIMEDLDRAAKFNETISAAAGQERNFGIIAERTEVG